LTLSKKEPNEPTVAPEIVTNEPTVTQKNVPNEPTMTRKISSNDHRCKSQFEDRTRDKLAIFDTFVPFSPG
jgi:hypothetical protein